MYVKRYHAPTLAMQSEDTVTGRAVSYLREEEQDRVQDKVHYI